MDLEKGLATLIEVIEKRIRHRYYDRVCEHADLMRRLITGEGAEDILYQFVKRETEEDFQQRVMLTQIITPAICSSIMNPANKIPRVRPTVNSIEVQNIENGDGMMMVQNEEEQLANVFYAVDNYYGGESVDKFMGRVFIPLTYIDPNAFILTTFDDFDANYEKAQPYPTIIPSQSAIDYKYVNGLLDYLIIKLNHQIPPKNQYEQSTQGETYRIYLGADIIQFKQERLDLEAAVTLTNGAYMSPTDNMSTGLYKSSRGIVYSVSFYQPKAEEVQAVRIGCMYDPTTDFQTCISPLSSAVPYLMKSIKLVSELDLSYTLHVFPQKFSYYEPCPGEVGHGCDKGITVAGNSCTLCGGSGRSIHTSAQDTIEFAIPRDPQQAMALSNLVHYADLPMGVIGSLQDYLAYIERKAIKAVYNSELFSTDSVAATATEKLVDMESVYDALLPIAEQYSYVRKHIVKLCATFVDANVVVYHQFPRDFKLKTYRMLIEELAMATGESVPEFARQAISKDLADSMFADQPETLKRIQVQQQFDPFSGKNPNQIAMLLNSEFVSQYSKTLWAEWANIWTELEEESWQNGSGIWLYDLAQQKIKELLIAKVTSYIEMLSNQKQSQYPSALTQSDIEMLLQTQGQNTIEQRNSVNNQEDISNNTQQ
jgi:hypothetical protein